MDITFPTSVLTVVLEVVILTTGQEAVSLSLRDVVSPQAVWVEILEWELMVVQHTELMVGIVIVTITMTQCLLELHLSELLVYHMAQDSAGFVVVVGLFLTDMVDTVVSLHTVVVDTVDRVVKVEEDSLRSLTSKPNKKICQKGVINPLFL